MLDAGGVRTGTVALGGCSAQPPSSPANPAASKAGLKWLHRPAADERLYNNPRHGLV